MPRRTCLQNEYGDCKDKANLFNTLLHSVGIEAHLVLVPRFSQAHEDLPGLSFNHAISRVTPGWRDAVGGYDGRRLPVRDAAAGRSGPEGAGD